MGKQKASEKLAEVVGAAVESVENDPILKFKEALGKAMDADPVAVEKALTQVLGVQSHAARTVEPERKRKVEIPKAETVAQPPEPPAPPKPGVVFAGVPGNSLIAIPSTKRHYGEGQMEITPPREVRVEQGGTIRVTDTEVIAGARRKIAEIKAKGRVPPIVELRDEITEHIEAGRTVTAIASQSVTVDTPLVDLVQ